MLVATDIAARGIDIDDLSHVINFQLTRCARNLCARIRADRQGRQFGIAFSFCGADERDALKDIQKLIGKNIPVVNEHPFPSDAPAAPVPAMVRQKHLNKAGGGNRGKSNHLSSAGKR